VKTAVICDDAKARTLHLASPGDSGHVIVPLMPGGQPLVSRGNKKELKTFQGAPGKAEYRDTWKPEQQKQYRLPAVGVLLVLEGTSGVRISRMVARPEELYDQV